MTSRGRGLSRRSLGGAEDTTAADALASAGMAANAWGDFMAEATAGLEEDGRADDAAAAVPTMRPPAMHQALIISGSSITLMDQSQFRVWG